MPTATSVTASPASRRKVGDGRVKSFYYPATIESLMNPVLAMSGRAQAGLVRSGEISSRELVEVHLARIAEVNPQLNAVAEVLSERALTAADAADARRAAGLEMRAFEGVPFSVKDSIEVQGTVCTAGTVGYRDNAPSGRDATLVARLRGAGAIPVA